MTNLCGINPKSGLCKRGINNDTHLCENPPITNKRCKKIKKRKSRKSPIKSKSKSPIKSRSKSPIKSRSKSPIKSRSRSKSKKSKGYKGVGLFIIDEEPGHESSAYGTCYILKSRLGVQRCEFIYTKYPNKVGDKLYGGDSELYFQLENKLMDLLENGYTHLYLFMECHGGKNGFCYHPQGFGAFNINSIIKIWKKYYDSWKSAIFICDSCASNLLIKEAKRKKTNNIIGFGVPGKCTDEISKSQLRIIKAVTFSAINKLSMLSSKYNTDVKQFLSILYDTWKDWKSINLRSNYYKNIDYYNTKIFSTDLDDRQISLVVGDVNNISGDYQPIGYIDENQLGHNNSSFNAGWKPLIFWWLTTPYNDIQDDEYKWILQFIIEKYKKGDDIKIYYFQKESLIETVNIMLQQSPKFNKRLYNIHQKLENLRDKHFIKNKTKSPIRNKTKQFCGVNPKTGLCKRGINNNTHLCENPPVTNKKCKIKKNSRKSPIKSKSKSPIKSKNSNKSKKISRHNLNIINGYKLIKLLGKGRYGSVYKVSKDNKIYAMKIVAAGSPVTKKRFINEVKIQKKASTLNIAPDIIDHFIQRNNNKTEGHIVMEYIEGPTLRDLYHNSTEDNTSIALEALSKIKILNENNILHSDLNKLDNIIYDRINNKVYILDYGLAEVRNDIFETRHLIDFDTAHLKARFNL